MKQAGRRKGDLAVRAIFALVAIGYAAPAYRFAEVAALSVNAPIKATNLAPHDATALANALGSRYDVNPEFEPGAEDIKNIRTALAEQPLEPTLLSILALIYEGSGSTQRAFEAMRIANRASRRSIISGLYLIEVGANKGDVKETLEHYSALLYTQPMLAEKLFHVLSSAISYPEIRQELRKYISSDEKWVPPFLAYSIEKADLADLEALLMPIPKNLLKEEYVPAVAKLIYRMVREGHLISALRVVKSIVPEFEISNLGDLSADPIEIDKRLQPFAWNLPPVDGIDVELDEGKQLKIDAHPLSGGVIASRDLLLPVTGKYQFSQNLRYIQGAELFNVRWSTYCISQTGLRQIWEEKLPPLVLQREYRSEFTVPEGCNFVRLTLFVEGPDSQAPATLEIDKLKLSPPKFINN